MSKETIGPRNGSFRQRQQYVMARMYVRGKKWTMMKSPRRLKLGELALV